MRFLLVQYVVLAEDENNKLRISTTSRTNFWGGPPPSVFVRRRNKMFINVKYIKPTTLTLIPLTWRIW
jgi:hypothetical protein